jgi:hypothetical protein
MLIVLLLLIIIILITVLVLQSKKRRKQGKVNIGHIDHSLLVVKDLEQEDNARFFRNLKEWEMKRDKYG